MTSDAIEYALAHLFDIANPNRSVRYSISVDDAQEDRSGQRKVTVVFPNCTNKITFFLAPDKDWYSIINARETELTWIDNSRGTYRIPILFWGKRDLPFMVTQNQNEVTVYGDIISSTFFMLSRWEEKQSEDSDIHGRFRYENSVACKYGFIAIPVVDEYAMFLRKILSQLFPYNDLGRGKFRVKLSHDIDDIRRFENTKQALRTIGGDVIKTRNPRIIMNSLREYVRSYGEPNNDPYLLSIYELAQLSRKHNMSSAFYFMTAELSAYDSGYNIENIRDCISYLQDEGFEVGFHPGYFTFRDYNRFFEEKQRLDRILGKLGYGGRQHYLRFDVNSTWRYWAQAGLEYDSSVGYAEHEGFRCGTCHPFKPFDIDAGCVLDIIEKPLVVMDVTLKDYRRLQPEEAVRSVKELAAKCISVEGTFTMLWHNTSVGRNWKHWYDLVYGTTLREFKKYL